MNMNTRKSRSKSSPRSKEKASSYREGAMEIVRQCGGPLPRKIVDSLSSMTDTQVMAVAHCVVKAQQNTITEFSMRWAGTEDTSGTHRRSGART
jgi:predicted metal-dependent TIM-barrel fold hydrolase